VTTSYAYESEDIVREARGATTLKYIHGPGVDDPLAVDDGIALSYFHGDGLGSVVKLSDPAAAVTLTRQYDAWGKIEAGRERAWLRLHWSGMGSRGRLLLLQGQILCG
jgi:hypothetical protein